MLNVASNLCFPPMGCHILLKDYVYTVVFAAFFPHKPFPDSLAFHNQYMIASQKMPERNNKSTVKKMDEYM